MTTMSPPKQQQQQQQQTNKKITTTWHESLLPAHISTISVQLQHTTKVFM